MKTTHTPGPWIWSINRKGKSVRLMTDGRGGTFVMGFDRWGTSHAAPCFRVDGIMHRADEMAVAIEGQEHNATWFADIDHPDAHLIAAAPDLLAALEALLHVDGDVPAKSHGDERCVAARAAIAKAKGVRR